MKVARVDTYILRAKQPVPYWGAHIYSVEEESKKRPGDEFGWGDISAVYPPKSATLGHYPRDITTVFVKIVADDGQYGWGESKATLAPRAVKAIVDELIAPLLLGKDPQELQVLYAKMQGLMKLRGHMQGFFQEALSGADIALWDLTARSLGLPVWKLLGGRFHQRVRVYASSVVGLPPGFGDVDVKQLRDQLEQVSKAGFKAVKIGLRGGIRNDVATIRLAREVLGQDFLIFVDAGGLYDRINALALSRALVKYEVGWLEAPLHYSDLEGYVELSRKSEVPIACDVIWSEPMVLSLLSRGARLIFQPDVIKAGGISGVVRIARLCEAFGLPFAPHVAQGSPIQFAATYHVCASAPNFYVAEYWYQPNPFADGLFKRKPTLEDGLLVVHEQPGLGIEVNEDAIPSFSWG